MCALSLGSFGGQYPVGVTPDFTSLQDLIRLSTTCLETSVTAVYRYIYACNILLIQNINNPGALQTNLALSQLAGGGALGAAGGMSGNGNGNINAASILAANANMNISNVASTLQIALLNLLHEFKQHGASHNVGLSQKSKEFLAMIDDSLRCIEAGMDGGFAGGAADMDGGFNPDEAAAEFSGGF